MKKPFRSSPSRLLLALGLLALLAPSTALAEPPIPSLVDTQADGRLVADAEGSLVVDRQLRLFFDYLLSARGEVDDAVLRARVDHEAELRGLDAAPSAELRELFDRYLSYLETAEARVASATDVGAAYRRLMAVRAEVLGAATAKALFGSDLELEKAALTLQSRIAEARTDTERKAAHQAWEASLSAEEKQARSDATAPLRMMAEVKALRAAGGSDEEVWSLRSRYFGPEAANRLAALDRKRSRGATPHSDAGRFQRPEPGASGALH